MHLGIPVKLRMFVKPTTGPYPGEPCATTRCISEVIFGHPFWDCFGHPFWDCFTRIHSSGSFSIVMIVVLKGGSTTIFFPEVEMIWS